MFKNTVAKLAALVYGQSAYIQYTHTLHSLDPKLVKMTVGCGICHINTKTYVQFNWSFHRGKHKKTQRLPIRMFKNRISRTHTQICFKISILLAMAFIINNNKETGAFSQNISSLFWNSQIHYHVHMSLNRMIPIQWAGVHSSNALDLNPGGAWFESQQGHWLFWLRFFVVFFSSSWQMKREYQD
jgi:hypothetical protein